MKVKERKYDEWINDGKKNVCGSVSRWVVGYLVGVVIEAIQTVLDHVAIA